MSDALPVYDPEEPARLQENDWDCCCESIEWCLYSWGRAPDDNWIENSMIAAGVVDPSVGCTSRVGDGVAAWINAEYGEFGYVASYEPSGDVSFDQIASEAATRKHPLAGSGVGWYHWTGFRGYDPINDLLELANPAPGWMGIDQTMSRGQFAALGPFSLVRMTHPATEGLVPSPEPDPPPDLSSWNGQIGSGLLEMMSADRTAPAQEYSTWYPIGRNPAEIEEAVGVNGVIYRWLLTVNAGYRYSPD